ncbi:MAG: DEAD/DEAH box helicase [Firmicutes bacterium]|nr:DEAD/DEAH box helicase [Bacillota bacterium]
MSLNPVTASREIYDRFCSYISTSFRLNSADLNSQIEHALQEPGKFAKGPILEVIPPFVLGQSVNELIDQGVLSAGFRELNSESLPLGRPLFFHQEQAIRAICQQQRNAVVATGTGSGKTESFMIPILNHLFCQREREMLTPGVRALLLYPMNALANDQIKRLRGLLKETPDVTFGIYTGETEDRFIDAWGKYLRMYGEEPLVNEIISREQMRQSPPHILLTNYAMLEYLMLRPVDNVFFQGQYSGDWKFIVLDEAHTYTGAKGIEMAMLLARVKNAIAATPGQLRCILTSASLGRGREDAHLVARFASSLCGEDFQLNDVITATQLEYSATDQSFWGTPHPTLYEELQDWLGGVQDLETVEQILYEHGVPENQVNEFLDLATHNLKKALYTLLQGDTRVGQIMELLQNGPMDLGVFSGQVFPNDREALNRTTSLLDLCNHARLRSEDKALLPARFHFFIKALEGAFIAFAPRPQIYLDRVNRITYDDVEYRAFELGACTRCHGLYLVGELKQDGETGYSHLDSVSNQYNLESNKNLVYFAVAEDTVPELENEDDALEGLGLDIPSFNWFRLCVYCGGIGEENAPVICACHESKTIRVLKVTHKGQAVHKCGLCGSISSRVGIVRRFYLSEDAVSSVLGTALYQQLPGRTLAKHEEVMEHSIFGSLEGAATQEDERVKQLLVFSDSRQNAAFFAPYLGTTYRELLAKSFLVQTLEANKNACLEDNWSLADYHRRIRLHVQRLNVLKDTEDALSVEIWRWIMREFSIDTGWSGLQSMGLLAFIPDFDRVEHREMLWRLPALVEAGINPNEARTLYSFLLDQYRQNRAVEYPEAVGPHDSFFAPQNQQGGFWSKKPPGVDRQPRGYVLKGWLPAAQNIPNTRVDYISKILATNGIAPTEAEQVLNILWQSLVDPRSPLVKYLKSETVKGFGKIYKLDPAIYKVVPGRSNPRLQYYRCNVCHKVTLFNIKGVCPTYRCEGQIVPVDLDVDLGSNHYRYLYLNMRPEPMVAHEHTAQLATEYAAEVQTRFVQGDINVLSCSTTFELGVDVGELETVFMKNVPPTPANYAQRAGRAGRRTDTTAFALTYARLASHDFSQFSEPEKMISGVVRPPYFDVSNEKIATRHLYACAFAEFWRAYPAYFRTVEDFFCSDGPDLFRSFLETRPPMLLCTLKEVVPEGLQPVIGVDDWAWVEEMYARDGVMTKVVTELRKDLEGIEQAVELAIAERNFQKAARLERIRKTITARPLISYLSQRNLLPKYGFPVDVVSLDVNFHTSEAKNIDLSRDMQIAISEYAPDSQVVANGKLWTSRYVKRVPTRELVRYRYMRCVCGYFHKYLDLDQTIATNCPSCGRRQSGSSVFVVPEYGFVADSKPDQPGSQRPERTYSSRKFFSGGSKAIERSEVSLGGNILQINTHLHGTLTVVNSGNGRGFYLCKSCGYGSCQGKPSHHLNALGRECRGSFETVSLGYDFETDIVELDFSSALSGVKTLEGYWESLMYSIIEGLSYELEIDRNDIDGTIYVNLMGGRSIVLFDTVPGGAGHVKRILDDGCLESVLQCAMRLLERCRCGGGQGDTSCYGCLRNYRNQYIHDYLRRDYGLDALKRILG